jgi:hypothetical protein
MFRYGVALAICLGGLSASGVRAQESRMFRDAYGVMIGSDHASAVQGKNYYLSQQSNMADRGNVDAGVNPRGNVDVNPPGFVGDNPFGNSTGPNP